MFEGLFNRFAHSAGPYCSIAGACLRARGAFGGPPGAAWGPLGGLLGASWGAAGGLWGASWTVLGRFLKPRRPSWGHLGGVRSKKGGPSISAATLDRRHSPVGPLLGRSWSRLGALLGLSWGSLRPSWRRLEASEGHRTRKGWKAKLIDFP